MKKMKYIFIKSAGIAFSLLVLFSFHLIGDVPVNPELTGGETWNYIIITKETYAADFQTLAEYRTKQGLKAAIFTTDGDDGIYDTYSGVYDFELLQLGEYPSRIRAFLKDMYNDHGLEYVLIGGDTDVVPVRYTYGWTSQTYDNPPVDINGSIPTDLYYCAGLDTGEFDLDWNAQGYYYCDILENYFIGYEPPPSPTPPPSPPPAAPDYFAIHLKLGRVCVNSAAEISNYTNKVMEYEGADEYAHLEKATFIAPIQGGVTGIEKFILETEYDSNGVVSNWIPNFSSTMIVNRLYINGSFIIDDTLPTPSPTQQIYYATPSPLPTFNQVLGNSYSTANINTALNAGTNICTYGGHGYVGGFSSGFDNTDAYNLDSDDKYGGLFFTGTCDSAGFDAGASYIQNYDSWDEDCLGVSFLKSVDGGFTNYIGFARTTKIIADTFFQDLVKNLFNKYTSHEGVPLYYTAGNLYTIAKQALIDEYEDDLDIPVGTAGYYKRSNIMALALLGDPAVSIYTKEPRTFTVTHPSQITHDDPTDITVNVQWSGWPWYNVLVCLYKEGEIYETGYTNVQGNVTFDDVEADTTGTLYVTTTLHNYKRYSGTITVN